MITKFSVLYVGQIELHNVWVHGTQADAQADIMTGGRVIMGVGRCYHTREVARNSSPGSLATSCPPSRSGGNGPGPPGGYTPTG